MGLMLFRLSLRGRADLYCQTSHLLFSTTGGKWNLLFGVYDLQAKFNAEINMPVGQEEKSHMCSRNMGPVNRKLGKGNPL